MPQHDPRPAYPLPCPVCRSAMVGEKSTPDAEEFDKFACLNCGAEVMRENSRPDDASA